MEKTMKIMDSLLVSQVDYCGMRYLRIGYMNWMVYSNCDTTLNNVFPGSNKSVELENEYQKLKKTNKESEQNDSWKM